MCIGFSRTIAIVLIGILICHVQGLRKTLDFESSGVCESRQTVSDNDLYFLVANPRNDLPSGRDHCNIYFTADPPIRKFYLYIRKLQISDCGVSLKVYDGDPYLKNHRWALSCKRPPAWKLETWYGSIALRLEKYTAESSNNYAIDIILTTDQGPPVDTETPGGMEGISTGAIIGIAVGAGLGVTVIVGFVVFCACRMYSSDKDDKRPPSTVFSTAPPRLAHGFIKPDSPRASSSVHRVEFLGVGANEGRSVSSRYSATGSYRSKSSQSYENSAYTKSEDESSFDAVDGKLSSSPGMRKKTDRADAAKKEDNDTRSSYRKQNDQTSKQNAHGYRSEKSQNQTTSTNRSEKSENRSRTNKDDEYKQKQSSENSVRKVNERTRSDSKSKNYSERQRDKSSDKDERQREQRKSRLYEPDRKYHSDSDDRDRHKLNRRISSRSHDSRHRSRYDKEYNSSTSQESSDFRYDKSRSGRRHRDEEERHRDHSTSRRNGRNSTRDRSQSASKSARDRERHYYESDRKYRENDRDRNDYDSERRQRDRDTHNDSERPRRSRSRSETRSKYDDRYYSDSHRSPERRHNSRRNHSESRSRDPRFDSQRSRSRSQKDSYIRPSR